MIEHRTTTGTHMHADGRECLFHATDQQWRIMHPIDAMRDCDRNHPEGMDNPIPEVEWFPPGEEPLVPRPGGESADEKNCEHDPRYSRSECGMCGMQEAWCDKCGVSLCACSDGGESDG